jgi:hypothetical protein
MSERQRTAQAIYDAVKRATVPIVVAQPYDGAIKAFADSGIKCGA